jgi:glycosyltransferase involved in cell wall biosynthesis/Tfp pilus assembly protein PilF
MKRLTVVKVIDQFGWSYDFIGREQQRYTRHNLIVSKHDKVCLEGVNVIYIHSPNICDKVSQEFPLEAKEKGIKVIGAYGGDPNFWHSSVNPRYSHVDLVVTISPETYKFATNLYSDVPVIFLPESVDTNFFKPLSFESNSFNVGWAGSKFPLKRINILEKLKYPIIKQSQWGQEYFKENRKQDTMLKFYQFLDCFVLASTTECMPRVVLEAMACGLPVVSTRVGNLPILIENNWLVDVFPDETVIEQMNLKLDLLKNNSKLRTETSIRNRQFIDKFFSWRATQPIWDSVFSNLYDNNIDAILSSNERYLSNYKDFFDTTSTKKNFGLIKRHKIAYIIPGTGISGGIAVILQHVNRLQEKGFDVKLLSQDLKTKIEWCPNNVKIVPLDSKFKETNECFDILVATGWSTVEASKSIQAKRKFYFVQSDERRFFDDEKTKALVEKTYLTNYEYMTEAKWIQTWLKKEFGHESFYVPNGLDQKIFYKTQDSKRNKLRVLIEGPLTIPFKGVSDAYKAIKNINCEKWIVSSDGTPPKSWKYDKFFEAVPIGQMKEIYSSCDILLKMSKVEGFFGPPMEAMACGCVVVVSKCTGYDEYIENEKNALVVEQGDINGAAKAIKRLISDNKLRSQLVKNGFETIKQWTWERSIEFLEAAFSSNKIEPKQEEKEVKVEAIKQQRTNHEEKCEIIIVVHNALSYVQRCIDSIQKYTDISYSITIVDNNSNYETKNYLRSIKDITLITNKKNYGFGYANNQAIRQSNSKYICFLNSDTIVTKNWLSNLISCLENNNAGIVGPVSNSVSSEIQQVDFDYIHCTSNNNDSKIQEFSEKRSIQFKEKIAETNRLIGFCMLTKKSILEQSGIFDDRYEFNFEDDDLCLNVIEQGYKLYCALDSFVYHFGGQTFKDRFKETTHNPTLEKSKNLFTKKWYDTNRIKEIHKKKEKLSIIYLLASDSPSGGVKVVFEQANRLKDRGHDVSIYCNKHESDSWFDLHAPIFYFTDHQEIPKSDIAIGTYFSTLPILQKLESTLKIHLCQGYEVSLYDPEKEKAIILTIKDDYRRIKEKIVVSKWLKEQIDSEFNTDTCYIPNGIDKYVFSLNKHEKNKIPRILVVGNYNLEIKGVHIALEAVKKYQENNKITIVRLASEKTKNDEEFEFHDMSKMIQDDIAKIYDSCDVTVCASYKVEGFSLPPLESMASGTPVITTDSGGVNDYAINNQNSLIVSPGNSKAIHHALCLLLTNETLYSRLVEQGLQTANNYLWHTRIDMLESHLYRLHQKQIELQKEQLSVCMIVKNEEQTLEKCLNSVRDIASEIIIVDTGSTDETIRIAKKFGAKIFHHNWNDDFSSARNFSIEKATQPWILILDADESIASSDIPKIRQLLQGEQVAYSIITRNYVDSKNIEDIKLCSGQYKEEESDSIGWCESEKVRLFPNIVGVKFTGQVHELVEDSLKSLSFPIKKSDIPVHHYGYLKKDRNKDEIYLKLGKKKIQSQEDSKALYELAQQYMALNNYDEALVIWRKLLEQDSKSFDYLARMGTTFNLLNDFVQAEKCFLDSISLKETEYTLKHLGICYAKQEKFEEAYQTFKKIVYFSEDLKTMADFAFCCNSLKKFDESITILEKCLKLNKKETISWGLLEIAYNEKGIELARKNRLPQAMNMFKSALTVNSSFDVARNNLAELNKILNSRQFSKTFIR